MIRFILSNPLRRKSNSLFPSGGWSYINRASTIYLSQRSYATHNNNKLKSTSSFVPSSKQPITDASALQEYAKCKAAMQAATDYFRKECAASENRALGRVTPALLSPVRVKLPENPKGTTTRLEELATVGVREGSTLLITLFDEHVGFLKVVVILTDCFTSSVDDKTCRGCAI